MRPNYIISDNFHKFMCEHFNFPPGVYEYEIKVKHNDIIRINCDFNLSWKHKRSYYETLQDIKTGLTETALLIQTMGGLI